MSDTGMMELVLNTIKGMVKGSSNIKESLITVEELDEVGNGNSQRVPFRGVLYVMTKEMDMRFTVRFEFNSDNCNLALYGKGENPLNAHANAIVSVDVYYYNGLEEIKKFLATLKAHVENLGKQRPALQQFLKPKDP